MGGDGGGGDTTPDVARLVFEAHLAQRAEVRAALVAALATRCRGEPAMAAAAAGGSAAARPTDGPRLAGEATATLAAGAAGPAAAGPATTPPNPAAALGAEATRAASAEAEWAALRAGGLAAVEQLAAAAMQAKGGAAFHVPAPLLLRCLRALPPARDLSASLQAEAPVGLGEGVTALGGAPAAAGRVG